MSMTIEEFKKLTQAQTRERSDAAPPKHRKNKDHYRAKYAAPLPAQTEMERQQQRVLFGRHDTVKVEIRLPLAPTANNIKIIRHVPGKSPWLAPSGEYEAYKQAVAQLWIAHNKGWAPEPLTGRLRIQAIVHQARRGGDILNREKACMDALTEARVWLDDEQIDDAHFIRGAIVPGGCIDLTIEVIPWGES
jgi:crossover junction endodeoxyribonuclease RusA